MALKYLNVYAYQQRVDLKSKYPGSSPDAIDFMNRLLVFNPFFRMTLDEAINHPFMDAVRTTPVKDIGSKINFEFDKEDLTHQQLRQLFINEIMLYGKNKFYNN